MHIVMLEDEPIVAQRIERLTRELLEDKLSILKWFNTVDAALDYLAEKPIDLLLLDLNLSGRDGFEILKSVPIEVVLSDQRMPGKTGIDFFESILAEISSSDYYSFEELYAII